MRSGGRFHSTPGKECEKAWFALVRCPRSACRAVLSGANSCSVRQPPSQPSSDSRPIIPILLAKLFFHMALFRNREQSGEQPEHQRTQNQGNESARQDRSPKNDAQEPQIHWVTADSKRALVYDNARILKRLHLCPYPFEQGIRPHGKRCPDSQDRNADQPPPPPYYPGARQQEVKQHHSHQADE